MTEPPSNLTSLRARLRNYARDVNSLEARVQRRLAALVVNEIFTSVDIGAEPPVLLKGGTALDLRRRPAPARLSKDWDAAVRGDLDEFIAKARDQLAAGWAGFTGRIAREQTVQVPGLEAPPRRFEVKLSYRSKPFATVPVEISTTEAHADEHDVLQVSEYDTIGIAPTVPVYCLSLRYQIAQKIHACTDPLDGQRTNDRARDLIDLQLLAALLTDAERPTLSSIRQACTDIFTSRDRHPWPPTVTVWPHWPSLYTVAAAEVRDDVAADVDEAAQWLQCFIRDLDNAVDK